MPNYYTRKRKIALNRTLTTDPTAKLLRQHLFRWWFLACLLMLAMLGLLCRMIDLNVITQHFLRAQGDARTLRDMSIPAYRGMIVDRTGAPLAVSTPVASLWMNPQEFMATDEQYTLLSKALSTPLFALKKRITAAKKQKKEFIYLQRHLDPETADFVKQLKLPGLYFQREYRRYYPEGEVMAHVIGLTNIDDKGQEGLELTFNHWLQGVPGIERVIKDRLGQVVSVLGTIREPKPGRTLTLSLDRRIQFLAYSELKEALKKFDAESGSVVVLDVKTGEIVSMVNLPTYNPNNRPSLHDGRFRNRAVTDIFEPGSTAKAFTVTDALIKGRYQPDSKIDTSPGFMSVEGHRVEDEHNNGVLTVTEILKKSSNVGVTKLILSLPPESLWELLHQVGFGQSTESGFPGESTGALPAERVWRPFRLATLSFGYGLSVTALQLAHAYSILAADGRDRGVTFLKQEDSPPAGKIVIPAKIAKTIRLMLESVLQSGGTATRAKIPGYRVTGKTGTVRIVGPHGYEKHHHIGIFVGMAPATQPRFVVAVVIHNPQGALYHGGSVAAPVFAGVMGGALRIMGVPPDDLPSDPN